MSSRNIAVVSAAALLMAAGPAVADAQVWNQAFGRVGVPAAPAATTTAAAPAAAAPADSDASAGAFRFGAQSRTALQLLWGESIAAGEERVGCIGGYIENGTIYITKASRLEPAFADSARVSAASSLRECRPPEWIGTVHTHIARYNGMPYTTFSAPDREVMHRWTQRWETAGTFCILYSEYQARCEISNGVSADALYSSRPQEGREQGAVGREQ